MTHPTDLEYKPEHVAPRYCPTAVVLLGIPGDDPTARAAVAWAKANNVPVITGTGSLRNWLESEGTMTPEVRAALQRCMNGGNWS